MNTEEGFEPESKINFSVGERSWLSYEILNLKKDSEKRKDLNKHLVDLDEKIIGLLFIDICRSEMLEGEFNRIMGKAVNAFEERRAECTGQKAAK